VACCRYVNRVGVVRRDLDAPDIGELRHARWRDILPAVAVVARDMNEPIIGRAQISPGRCGEGASDAHVACTSAPPFSYVISPPEGPCREISLRLRSGEISSQLMPSSRLRNTWLPAAYSIPLSCGEKAIGNVQAKRYLMSLGAIPRDASGHTLTSWICPVRWS